VQVISLLFSDAQTHYSDVKFLSLSRLLSLSLFIHSPSLALSLLLTPSPPLPLSFSLSRAGAQYIGNLMFEANAW
jgi:hypothetical protein